MIEVQAYNISTWKQKQGDQEFKARLSYLKTFYIIIIIILKTLDILKKGLGGQVNGRVVTVPSICERPGFKHYHHKGNTKKILGKKQKPTLINSRSDYCQILGIDYTCTLNLKTQSYSMIKYFLKMIINKNSESYSCRQKSAGKSRSSETKLQSWLCYCQLSAI